MKKNITADDLKLKIENLKIIQAQQLQELTVQLEVAKQSMQPLNIIKNTFIDAIDLAPSLKSNLISGAITLASTYLFKNSMLGNSDNKFARVAGRGLKLLLNNFKRFA